MAAISTMIRPLGAIRAITMPMPVKNNARPATRRIQAPASEVCLHPRHTPTYFYFYIYAWTVSYIPKFMVFLQFFFLFFHFFRRHIHSAA